jgi:hypothetical protein
MAQVTTTPREAFRIAYKYARNIRQQREAASGRPTAEQEGNTAFWIANAATDAAVENGLDYEPFLAVERAVLWAIHWRWCKPCRNDVPTGMSERHLCFVMSANPEESRTWYARRLPG